MGRRSQHTQEQLKELILAAARKGIEVGKGERPSARDIAREIGYAPGTLYNVFSNLDEIMLRVEAGVLEELDAHLGKAMQGRKGSEALRQFLAAYVEFAYENPQLWRLIQEHHPCEEKKTPDWYLERLYAPVSRLEAVIGKSNGSRDPDEIARKARLMWSVLHGIVHVATTAKFGAQPLATAVGMVQEMMDCYLTGQVDMPPVRERWDSERRLPEIKRA